MTERRRFIGLAATGFAALSAPELASASGVQQGDDPWLAAVASKRRRVFVDVHQFTAEFTAFTQADSILGALTAEYHVPAGDIGMAFGAHSTGLALLVKQGTWDELGIASLIGPKLLPADQDALRTARPGDATAARVRALVGKGVRVLACKNTISRWSTRLSANGKGTAESIATKLIDGLHDGVEPVPAMLVAAMMAEERGIPVVSAG